MSLLDKFADPQLIKELSLGDKLIASLQVTILGMLVTFVVLMLLWGLIIIMTKVLTGSTAKPEIKTVAKETIPSVQAVEEEDDEELVAVITAAVATILNTSTHNLVVRNIVRVEDATPAWGRVGRIDQMNSRF